MAVINPAAQGRIGATNLVQGQQAPVRVEGITPSAFGAVDNPLGGALERLGGAFEYAQQRQDAVDRTAAYAKMDEYQTGLHTTLDQLYRDTDPATSNYYETARGVIDNASQEFIAKNIPANLQDEFKARVASIAEAAKRQSYEDGRKQEDSFFDQSITNAITRAGNGFESGGWTREQADQYVDERIAATDLPPEERLKRRYAAHLQIAKMDYGRSIKAELSAGNVSGADLIRSFEGFEPMRIWITTRELTSLLVFAPAMAVIMWFALTEVAKRSPPTRLSPRPTVSALCSTDSPMNLSRRCGIRWEVRRGALFRRARVRHCFRSPGTMETCLLRSPTR
jgi:hypothetical protein